jgi:hypothetical protein
VTDTFNLTASFDKASYLPGDKITLSVAGAVTSGTATPIEATITVTAADGATTSISATSQVSDVDEAWAITAVTDTAGRTWAVASDGKSATTTA